MKISNAKRILFSLVLLAAAASFTSCNRGFGCPNNFSVNDTAVQVVKEVVNAIK